MMTQMGNTAGQADTLTGLGALYAAMYRLEDAVRFSLQAAKLYDTLGDQIGEGRARNNAASLLNALGRHDDARRELQRAIACLEPFGHAATPWTTFNNLHDLERAVGNPTAAATARQRALDSYLAYRRADGVSQSSLAELYILVAQALATHQHAEATSALTALAQEPDLPPYVPPVLTALQAMLAGARDPGLAHDPNLGYDDAAELRLLLEQCSTA